MQHSMLHRLFWGVVLVAVGVVFLLNQTGTVSIDIGWLFAHWWPALLILFGLQGLLVQRSGGFMWNIIVIVVGVVFLGRNMDWLQWSVQDMFRIIGPVVLILFGIGMITRGARPKRDNDEGEGPGYGWSPVTPPPISSPPVGPKGPPPAPPLADDPNASFTGSDGAGGPHREAAPAPKPPRMAPPSAERGFPAGYPPMFYHKMERLREKQQRKLEKWTRRRGHHHHHHHEWWTQDPNAAQHHRFIGDVHIGHDYWELKPMAISHFIGDTTLDLTKAQIPIGETKIHVSCFIGDVKVFVPNDPGVGVHVVSSSLIGDVRVLDQKRGGFFNQMSVETPSYPDTDKRVVLMVSCFIGDVRITKVG